MSINLSDLTSPNNQDSLAEITSGADFLDPIGKLENLSRGANKGGHALQTTALNQPRALPLIKNPTGDLGGYLYIPNVTGNYATGPSVTIGSNETWEGELDMVMTQWGQYILPMGGGDWDTGFGLIFYPDKRVRTFSKGSVLPNISASGVTLGTPFNAKFGFDGTNLYVDIDDSRVYELVAPDQSVSRTHELRLNSTPNLTQQGNYAIQKAKLTVNNAVVFDCDFNGSTSIRHGDTKFNCVGGPVSLTKAGNDPITVVKKSVLRFSTATSGLKGLFANQIDGGYMFAAFSVLGDGGENYGRVFGVNSTGEADNGNPRGYIFSLRNAATNDLSYYYDINYRASHTGLFDDELRDILHESKAADGTQVSKVNNSDIQTTSVDISALSSEEYNIAFADNGNNNAAIDLEFLALFPASITDAQADDVRNYINNRNNVFLRHDTDGYYFFDPLSLAADAPVSSWNGQIVGSDNDANLTITQSTANSQPDRLAPDKDGMVVRFNDSNDHLIVPSSFVEPAAGSWQVVGTSLGTFAYRVNANAVTELNLLGNLGHASYRQTGDLYGIILLPESATGADIEAARELLIDRGAADASTIISAGAAWFRRYDIVEFKNAEFPDALTLGFAFEEATNLSKISTVNAPLCPNFASTWKDCSALTSFPAGAKLGTEVNYVNFSNTWRGSGLTSFPALDLSNGNDFTNAWRGTNYLTEIASGLQLGNNPAYTGVSFTRAWQDGGLTSFPALDLSRGTAFDNAWLNCSALTTFPAGAKLGTSASNVDFTCAWRDSGLTSFPALDLSTATNLQSTWRDCDNMLTFGSVQTSSVTNFSDSWLGCDNLTSFPAIDTSSGIYFYRTWYSVRSITDFPLLNISSARNFKEAWNLCVALTNFPQGFFDSWSTTNISNGVFNQTWSNCTSLTAQSVENILTSIDASNQHGTDDGTSTGNPLGDSGIDIDYNVATGSLSAATNSAIDSLSGKGWEVYINGVLVIPNILDLQPAAAYSLRSFDADADPNVVNVRRSSDSATSDFKASEVSDGTLTDWVNTDVVITSSDFASTLSPFSLYNDTLTTTELNQSIAGVDGALKITFGGDTAFLRRAGSQTLGIGKQFKVSVKVYLPSSNDYVDGLTVSNTGLTNEYPTTTLAFDTWHTIEFTGVANVTSKTSGFRLYAKNRASSVDDVMYVKDYDITQLTADGHVTTWYDQSGNNNSSNQTLASSQPKIVDGGTLVTEGGLPSINFHTEVSNLSLNHSDIYGQATLDSYYVTNATGDAYLYPSLLLNGNAYGMTAFDGNNNTIISNNYGSPTFYANGTEITGTTRGDIYAATSGGRKLVGHQGADTSNGAWSSGSVNFGNFSFSATAFGFTGKLQEMIFFNTDQSANRTGIENNINDHFDIYS